MAGLMAAGQRVGLATDTGGGSSFSMLRTMAAAYEIGQLRHSPLHAAQLLWLATQGSARALHLEDRIGNLAAGMEATLGVCGLDRNGGSGRRARACLGALGDVLVHGGLSSVSCPDYN